MRPVSELKAEKTSSDYSANGVLTQSHALSLGYGSGVRSGRLGMTLTSIGAFIPQAYTASSSAPTAAFAWWDRRA